MKTLKLFGKYALGLLAIAAMFVGGEEGVAYAMAGVAGVTVTTEGVKGESPELNLDTIVQEIVNVSPARTPLDTLMRKVGRSIPAKSWKVDGYEVVQRPFVDTVKTAYETQSGVKSADIAVDNIGIWTLDHTIALQVGTKGNEPVAIVTDIDYKLGKVGLTMLSEDGVQPDFPSLSAGVKLTRMGTAMSETQSTTDAYAEIPTKESNFCQKFGSKISMSFIQQKVDQEVRWGFSDIQKLRIKAMREEIELTYLIGNKGYTQRQRGSKLEHVYTMGGILKHDIKKLEYGKGGADRTFDTSTMNDLMKEIYTGNAGSETRFALYGSSMGKYLYGINDWQKYLLGNQTEVVPGLTFGRYEHNYGKLMFAYSPLFDQLGWDECMLIVDINFLAKATLEPLRIVDLELEKTGQEDSNAKSIKETSCLLTLYPEVHAFISPKA